MSISISVRLPDGEVCSIDVTEHMRVNDIKKIVSYERRWEYDYFDLVYEGAILDTNIPAISLGLVDQSEIELVLSRKGAALTRLGNRPITCDEMIREVYSDGGNVADFIDAGIPANERISPGEAILSFCVSQGKLKAVQQLYSHPLVNINLLDAMGNSPLHVACNRGFDTIVKLLITHPHININIQNNDGWTPLYTAVANNRDDIVLLLSLTDGININLSTKQAWTPLRLASTKRRQDMVSILLARGGDQNGRKGVKITIMSFRKPVAEKQRVLILYTGGTIGMKNSDKGYIPATGYMAEKLHSLPQFHDRELYESKKEWIKTSHVMPLSSHGRYVGYDIKEYNPLLDSCNLSNNDWEKISKDIAEEYDNYDSFIVLHGTDTMAYTSSALSFMLQDLEKTVIVTGSQIPISQPRNDGVSNLEGALFVAGHYVIPEVTLYFSHKLYRGSRSSKADASTLTAFQSPNFPPIANVGINVDVNWHLIKSPHSGGFKAITTFDKDVAVVQLFPGLSTESLKRQLAPPLKGALLRTYGAGNAPDANKEFLSVLKEASDRGVIIVNTTQCWRGTVEGHYATGVALQDAGVIAGRDMTPESALVKLGWLLGQGLQPSEIRDLIPQSIRGELTPKVDMQFSLHDSGFVHTLYTVLKEQRGETRDGANIRHIREILLPTIICSASERGDVDELTSILNDGANVNSKDYDGRTGLHLAASCGQLEVVELLISQSGVEIDIQDRWKATPLLDAIRNDRDTCCEALRKAGATFTISDLEQAATLCRLSNDDDNESLKRWLKFGADPNVSDYDKRTPLHVAASSGKTDAVEILLKYGANPTPEDRWKSTPLQEAIIHQFDMCCEVLRKGGGRITISDTDLAAILCRLANSGDIASLERWFKNGANLNVADYDGRTPLHIASREGQSEVVKFLISSNCNVSPADRNNVTPLLDAITRGNDDICKVLVDSEADLNFKPTQLCSAVMDDNLQLVTRFCRYYPQSVIAADYDLRTPLHIAASEGNKKAVELLLSFNSNSSAKDRWGRTPKDDATSNGFDHIIVLLNQS